MIKYFKGQKKKDYFQKFKKIDATHGYGTQFGVTSLQ